MSLSPPFNFSRECDLMEKLDQVLTDAGWETMRFSARRKMPSQMRGWGDLWAVRDDHTLIIEGKSRTGEQEDSQREFEKRIKSHLGEHVRYIVLHDLRQLPREFIEPI